jgi:ankyrin repeat protein
MNKFKSYDNWLNEKFTEDSDPVHDMGIGMLAVIDDYIKQETSQNRYSQDFSKMQDKLVFCTNHGKTEFVDYLLSQMHLDDRSMSTALWRAIRNDKIDIVKLFIEKYNVDPLKDDANNVRYSISYNNKPIFKYFLETGIDPSFNNNIFLRTACRYGKEEIVKILINAGVDVKGEIGTSALDVAAQNGKTKAMRVLLDNGAKPGEHLLLKAKHWKERYYRIRVTTLLTKRGFIE